MNRYLCKHILCIQNDNALLVTFTVKHGAINVELFYYDSINSYTLL